MKIETITAHYSLTQSLSGYCNVKPGLSAIAVLEEGEDPNEAQEQLFEMLKPKVQAEVDEALERDGQPPKYYDGPRYKVIETPVAYLIWPNNQPRPEDYPDELWWREQWISDSRLEICREMAEGLRPPKGKRIFECLEGELPDDLLALIEEEKARRDEQEDGEMDSIDPFDADCDPGDDYDDEEW